MIKNNNQVEWILIEDKLKKEWNKQDANNKKEEEEDNLLDESQIKDLDN